DDFHDAPPATAGLVRPLQLLRADRPVAPLRHDASGGPEGEGGGRRAVLPDGQGRGRGRLRDPQRGGAREPLRIRRRQEGGRRQRREQRGQQCRWVITEASAVIRSQRAWITLGSGSRRTRTRPSTACGCAGPSSSSPSSTSSVTTCGAERVSAPTG